MCPSREEEEERSKTCSFFFFFSCLFQSCKRTLLCVWLAQQTKHTARERGAKKREEEANAPAAPPCRLDGRPQLDAILTASREGSPSRKLLLLLLGVKYRKEDFFPSRTSTRVSPFSLRKERSFGRKEGGEVRGRRSPDVLYRHLSILLSLLFFVFALRFHVVLPFSSSFLLATAGERSEATGFLSFFLPLKDISAPSLLLSVLHLSCSLLFAF